MADKNKVAIVYRIYPGVSKIPPVHSKDKYKLSELCLSSLVESLEGVDYKIWVLLDNCPPEYRDLFNKYLGDRGELIDLPGIGNAGTFGRQVEILLEQDFAEYVYFAEDDYFYLPGKFIEMLRFMDDNPDAHFVTPYDHLDYYTLDMHRYKSEIRFSEHRHWRTGGSTCMTFLTSKAVLQRTRKIFMTYTRRNYDGSLWFTITKTKLRNPLNMIKYLLTDNGMFKIFAKAYYFSLVEIFFGRKWKLWVPLPSIATHMDNKYLAPNYDWYRIFDEHENK